jgi:hypothetical protein
MSFVSGIIVAYRKSLLETCRVRTECGEREFRSEGKLAAIGGRVAVLVGDSSDWAELNLETSRSSEHQPAKSGIIRDRCRLSLAPEYGAFEGPHATDAVPGFSLLEAAIIGSSHNNLQVLQCQISKFLFYSFADPFVPVHDSPGYCISRVSTCQ